ncbi:hypothetical protein [Jiangella rhizosphaerae]|uniref:Uncharacterized protein n=1 Tax=Jiangella rhizosphaerae TaxID=2293569 RepID=A0A418KII0_9ACTN|nr:hypothetical protein [Jiangella rhizosphaerae]RIQ13242.1 hypothetical protein DY240_26190 [Jiangella rhizosphaerae]
MASANNRRPFVPDGIVTVTGAQVLAEEFSPSTDVFLIRQKGAREAAWARWVGEDNPWGGRARVVTLACAECDAWTGDRCCGLAFCAPHRELHRAVEHVRPDQGRYRAIVDAAPLTVFRHADGAGPVSGLRYPRDMSIQAAMRAERSPSNGLRVVEHVRRYTYVPGGPDPIGAALAALAQRGGRLPAPAAARWLACDLLARCTFPALLDVLGRSGEAEWLRRQPRLMTARSSVLRERVDELGLGRFGLLGLPASASDAAEAAACDLFRELYMLTPGYGPGGLDIGVDESDLVLEMVLREPDGPERVGRVVARAHDDAVATVVKALSGR